MDRSLKPLFFSDCWICVMCFARRSDSLVTYAGRVTETLCPQGSGLIVDLLALVVASLVVVRLGRKA
jgi:hypothetical protein